MGKIFPRITHLKESPHLLEKTLSLIEKTFEYKGPYAFKEDFAPLIAASNHHNCFIIVDDQENVLAHVGAKESFLTINKKTFPVTMFGGIAVEEKHRGEGHFQTLFQDVLAEKRSDSTFFLLWSDLEKLYKKYSFHLCGQQFELALSDKKTSFKKTKYYLLSTQEKLKIHELYQKSFSQIYLTINRSEKEWSEIEMISSADLYIRRNGSQISDYFFMNKGQDLPGIIYEYGGHSPIKDLISDISGYGKVWMAKEFVSTETSQYQFLLAPSDPKLFAGFVLALTEEKISIRDINLMKQEVFFDYNDELLSLELPDFLRGIFGPGKFEELSIQDVFISGVDSI